jgi:penicillin amidase
MDLARRLTQGKLSEVLGPEMVEFDKFNLRMLKDYWTKQTVQFLLESNDPVDQEIMQKLLAYVRGINFYITHCPALPLEFQFLAYEPTLWTIEDSLGFIKYMAEMLTWSYSDFTIFSISDAIGEEGCLNLYSRLPYQIPICPNYGEFQDIHTNASIKTSNSFSFMASATKTSLKNFFSHFMTFIQSLPGESHRIQNQFLVGSNNWVIDGSKSETGFPILCNDMHLAHSLPGIWYEAHLVNTQLAADFNVYGFFLAGVPYPIVGHNSYVGWGMTNTGFDVIDWYYYNGINETHYWYNNEALAYELINYSLTVKNAPAHTFSIKNTVHGPVFDSTDITNLPANYSNLVLACK